MNDIYKSLNSINEVHFSSCEGCQTPCCDGQKFFFIPLILEDFVEVYKNFAIVFAYIDGELRVLMVLSKDAKPCSYFVESKCSIYDERPPGCKLYPFTPFFDDVLIDTSCPAINEKGEGDFFASKESINSSFYHKRLENFNAKRLKTKAYLQELEKSMQKVGNVNGVDIYKYVGVKSDDFIQMHQLSLKFL